MEQIAINILPKGAKPVCHSSQFDEGRQIMFNLFNDDTPYTLSGTETISVLVRKPDGTEVIDSVTNTSDSYVIWDVSADACELSGVCECEISIVENGILLGSKNFTMKVEEDAYGGRNIEVRTASGSIATFSTNMVEAFKSLKSDINPVQDLHGYSKPWSGGAGKNKLEPCITSGTINGITYTVNDDGTIRLSNTATSEAIKVGGFDLKAGSYIYTSGVTESFDTFDTYLSVGGTTIARGLSGYNSFTLAQDSTVAFGVRVRNGITPNVTIKPMVRLANVSDATFEPYENICPISGFSALNVTRTGKNLFDKNSITGSSYIDTDGTIRTTSGWCVSDYIPVAVGNYTASQYAESGSGVYLAVFDTNKNIVRTVQMRTGLENTTLVTIGANEAYIRMSVRMTQIDTAQFENGNQASEYHAYNGQTATVNFGQTVYGGVADVTGGKVNSTHGIVDLGSLNWLYNSTQQVFNATIDDIYNRTAGTENDAICSNYAGENVWNASNLSNGCFMIRGDISRVYIKDTNYTDGATFKTAMSGVMFCYALATPIEITTTPENLTAISGENNVYSDTNGDTEVEYYIEV